ncbi:hypothetical protein EG829_15045 [bacterium]|nr:hypothetical protein [bacterium]
MGANEQISITDAAKEVGSTHLRLLMLIKQGALQGELRDGEWYVSRDALAGFAAAEGENRPVLACAAACKASSCGCR